MVSPTDGASPATSGPDGPRERARAALRRLRGLRGWEAAVAGSVVLLAIVGIALGIDWLITLRSHDAVYSVPRPASRLELDVSSGGVTIQGGDPGAIRVRRVERSAFGRWPHEQRSQVGGVLRVSSRCPRVVVGDCSAAYRITVPDDVAVSVRTGRGDVRLAGFHGSAQIRTRSGDVGVDAFCGFRLSAASASGAIRAIAACAPKSLDLRSGSGDATAVVPPGRYRIRATSDTGARRVTGLMPTATARFGIAVRSHSGAVTVVGGL